MTKTAQKMTIFPKSGTKKGIKIPGTMEKLRAVCYNELARFGEQHHPEPGILPGSIFYLKFFSNRQ